MINYIGSNPPAALTSMPQLNQYKEISSDSPIICSAAPTQLFH